MTNTSNTNEVYPGNDATAKEILSLAREYRLTASALDKLRKQNQRLSSAPYRFAAVHAIELYLNAYLMHHGLTPAEIRGTAHDLEFRAASAREHGLILRCKTIALITRINQNREYLIVRYGYKQMAAVVSVTELQSVLNEVSKKVTANI